MATVERAVYIGGPSHGEIAGGTFNLDDTEVVTGPKPIWWNWDDEFRHYYRPRGCEAAGMAVYEYVGQVPPPPQDFRGEPDPAVERERLRAIIREELDRRNV